jgi:hypothetical protein
MFVGDTVTGQLVVMFSLGFGERYGRFVFSLPLSFKGGDAVAMNFFNALVPTVGFGGDVIRKVHFGLFEQFKVMGFTFREICANDLLGLFVYHDLALGSMALLLS